MSKLTIGSLFSGIGGLEQELLKTGKYELKYLADPNKWCKAALKYLHPDIPNLGSVTKMDPKDVPYTDLIMGGSSCQDLSYQGKREGLSGKKSKLFYNMMDIVKEVQPKYVVWENVAGALTAKKKKDFEIIKQLFKEANYEIDYEIFDASRYSPTIQQRKRIILLATHQKYDKVSLNKSVPSFTLDDKMQAIKGRLVGVSKSHRDEHLDFRLNHGIANTLVTGWGCVGQSTANYIVEDGVFRDLTPEECEILMTWKEGLTAKGVIDGKVVDIPTEERYNICGNGVVSKMIPHLLKNLK